ncbi:MAG: pilus assembly protein [Armatimonadetes bacterium]|nr:pilus assembly protein [Armatimonadota bacterium]
MPGAKREKQPRASGERRRSGAVTIEMAAMLPLLIIVLFGIIEVGLIVADSVRINQLAREATRLATIGKAPPVIDAAIDDEATGIDSSHLVRLYEYRPYDRNTGTWGDWVAMGGVSINTARDGDMVRVSLTYPHHLVTGGLLNMLADDRQEGIIYLRALVTMRRE